MNIINQHTKIVFGENSIKYLERIKNSRILIVTDKFLVENLIINKVTENIDNSNQIYVYDDVKPDPTLKVVSSSLAIFLKNKIDIIIGFGGGSSIDTAKAIIYFANGNKHNNMNIEFIAIPTTSGTGSESTSVAVITDDETMIKHVIMSQDILPNVAILDSIFTDTLPDFIIANTGMDVFTHALEAYVAKGANEYSDALSEKSGELVFKYLYNSFLGNNDETAKEKIHIASNLAGIAFNIAGLGLNHSIAHQIGSKYHIPHGLANALVMISVIDYNSFDENTKYKYAEYARKIGLIEKSASDNLALEYLKKFIIVLTKIMGMPQSLSDCNVDLKNWENDKIIISKNTLKDNCLQSNPISISEEEVLDILDKIY